MSFEAQAPGLPDPVGRGEDPLYYFTRIYLLFLQGLFQQFDQGSYKWSDDDRITEIVITDQSPIPRSRIEQRPAIIAMRGPAQFANMSLDNVRKVDMRTGAKERTDMVTCTMSLCCIAKMGPEAQRIAWIVMSRIRGFKELLQRAGLHKTGDELSITPESPPGAVISGEGDMEAVMVTVQSPFFFQWTEVVTPLYAPHLQAIEVHMRAGLAQNITTAEKQETVAALKPPTIRGRVLVPVVVPNSRPIEQTLKT
jgi:hypothetical protein